MSFDPERLRALAEASQARDDENAARQLAQFKSERLAAFSEWLNVELEREAGFGGRSVTLRFDSHYFGDLGGKAAFNEPAQHKLPCWHAYLYLSMGSCRLPEDQVFWVGPFSLPIARVAECVIESAQKAGITAKLDWEGSEQYDLTLSW